MSCLEQSCFVDWNILSHFLFGNVNEELLLLKNVNIMSCCIGFNAHTSLEQNLYFVKYLCGSTWYLEHHVYLIIIKRMSQHCPWILWDHFNVTKQVISLLFPKLFRSCYSFKHWLFVLSLSASSNINYLQWRFYTW